ncbi:MAG: hypothetical protein QM723_03035 [Myxococcaceae bacterium]
MLRGGIHDMVADDRFFVPPPPVLPFEGVPRGRPLVLALEAVLALNAVIAGVAFIARPDGSLLGMTAELLVHGPFSSFLVPGLLLAGVIGGLNTAGLVLTLRRSSWSRRAGLVAGVATVVFEIVESTMIPYSWLQPAVGLCGLAVTLASLAARR